MVKKKVRRIEDEVEPGRRLKLEEPGKPRDYDMPKEMVMQMHSEFYLGQLLKDIIGKDPMMTKQFLANFGKSFMERIIELADMKYKDRTTEMIERVAKMTKISFPHRFQRYVELSLLCLNSVNQYVVEKTTTKELEIEVHDCSLYREIGDPALCHSLCSTLFETAWQKTGDKVKLTAGLNSIIEGICKFRFTLQTK